MWSVPDHQETCIATLVVPNAAQTHWHGMDCSNNFLLGEVPKVWVRIRSAMVTVEQLLSRQISRSGAVGNTVQ